MNAYLEFNKDTFRDKTILLPCDDPEWSNFTKYFAQNFGRLGLKKLISTSYAPDSKPRELDLQLALFETQSPKFDKTKARANGKIYTLTRDTTGDAKSGSTLVATVTFGAPKYRHFATKLTSSSLIPLSPFFGSFLLG
jgi:hypothetical protein